MKFIHRLGYYLGGFALGLIILAFFLSGKRASCDYSPDARVLKNIRIKDHVYSESALLSMQRHNIDSTKISHVLHNGDVDFGRSNTEPDTCKTYLVTGKVQSQNLELLFKNCDSVATLEELWVK